MDADASHCTFEAFLFTSDPKYPEQLPKMDLRKRRLSDEQRIPNAWDSSPFPPRSGGEGRDEGGALGIGDVSDGEDEVLILASTVVIDMCVMAAISGGEM
jgi:hypothetical protein